MKKLLDYDFEFVDYLKPVLDSYGKVKEFYPLANNNNTKNMILNKYGGGAFCRFSIDAKWSGISGVYAFYIDDELVYIGQCLDFAKRFNMGYGNISAQCCYTQGQSTNCKMNKVVLESAKTGKQVALYFHKTEKYFSVEKELIRHFNPLYNVALKEKMAETTTVERPSNIISEKYVKKTYSSAIERTPSGNPTIDEVRKHIRETLRKAKEKGLKEYVLVAGDIHTDLKMDRAMPTVCSALRTSGSGYKYVELEVPPKGNGSRLKFKYILN